MSKHVSVDLAGSLREAGLQHEGWSIGDWAWAPAGSGCMGIVFSASALAVRLWTPGLIDADPQTCHWLPTLSDCLALLAGMALYPVLARYPDSLAGDSDWGCAVSDDHERHVAEMQCHADATEAAGLALLAALQARKGGAGAEAQVVFEG